MKMPLLTVLMPVYNGEDFLRESIESILNQTYTDFLFLIINDGSTDNSENIILSYHDERIIYVKNEQNLKLIRTLNKGISLVRTKYVARMDADDVSLPERLEKQVRYMEANPEIGVLGAWCQSFGEGYNHIVKYQAEHESIRYKQLYQIQLVHPTCIMRMDVLRSQSVVYDNNYTHAEDYELFTRLSHVTKLANLQEVLHLYRKHSNAVSTVYSKPQLEASIRIKQREFALLGVNATESQIESFKLLNYQDYNNLALSANEIMSLLESIVNANELSSYIEWDYLNNMLSQLWFSYCYETKQPIRVFKSSKLQYRLSLVRYAKWIIKRFY
ncbi:MAG: glycosyltransferase [Bacteroidales bacterium]|nr:glycosyltransferase [Bacteroidales bacterium]